MAKCTAEQIAVVQPGETISAIIDTPATQLPQWGPEAVAFDPQTKRLFSVETNGDVTIIDATTNTIIKKRTFGEGGGWPMTASIAVDQVGRRVISTIRLWHAQETGRARRRFFGRGRYLQRRRRYSWHGGER